MNDAEATPGGAAAGGASRTTGAGRTLNRDYKHVAQGRARAGAGLSPAWAFAAGLGCGLAVALGVWLNLREPAPAQPQAAAEATPASQRAADEAPGETGGEVAAVPPPDPSTTSGVELDFYDSLPTSTVEVNHEKPPSTAAPREEALLQVGSFRSAEEAEKLQARLKSYGLDSRAQRYTVDDETWYRVRIGPLHSAEAVREAEDKLAEAQIEAFVVPPNSEMPPP